MNNQAKLRTNHLYSIMEQTRTNHKPYQSSLMNLVDYTWDTIHHTNWSFYLFVQPEDWDEQEYISDPEDKKPDGYDDIPKEIPDTDSKKVHTCL